MMFVFLIPSFFIWIVLEWVGMDEDYKDNLQNDGPSKAQILQDRQRLRVMDIYKQSCELKLSRVPKNRPIRLFCGLYPGCL